MRRTAVWALVGLVLAGVFFVLRVIFMRHPPASPGDWAAWVQAIGSIVAIIAAAGGVQWAHSLSSRAAAKSAAADEVRKLAAIASCLFHCRSQAEALKRFCAYKPNVNENLDALGNHVNMLQAINLLDIPDWRGAVAVGQTLAVYSYMRGKLLTTEPIAALEQSMSETRVAHCEAAINRFRESEELLRVTLKNRGSDVPMQQIDFADGPVQSLSTMDLMKAKAEKGAT